MVFLFSLQGALSLATLFYMEEVEKNIAPPNQVRNYRTDKNLSQSDIAFLLDIKNGGRISEWENGLSNPGIEHLFTLSLIFHRLPDQIFYELKKRLSDKLEVRYKLLIELKKKKGMQDESG